LLFAFAAAFSVSLAYLGLAAFTLAFVAQGARLRRLLQEPVVWAGLVFAAFVTLHSAIWYLQAPTPEYAHVVARTGADWVKLLLFVPLAWWLARWPRRIGLVLFLAVLGLALGFLRKVDWLTLDAAFLARQFWDYLPPLALGLFSGVGAIGLLVCRAGVFARLGPGPWRWPAVVAYLLLVALLLQMLVLSFSRSAWLSFAACLVLWGGLAGTHALRQRDPRTWRRGFWSGIAVLVLLGVAAGMNRDALTARLGEEHQTLTQIAAGHLDDANRSSIALRLHAWRFAYDMWLERPWFGWGSGTSPYWIQQSGLERLKDHDLWLSDLHNTYIELLFQLGLVGTSLLMLLVGLLVRDASRRCLQDPSPEGHDRPPCLCDLLLIAGAFVAIWMLADHRATNHDWRFFWMLLAGSAYALHLAPILAPRQPQEGEA
jgi:O-antigen ligase